MHTNIQVISATVYPMALLTAGCRHAQQVFFQLPAHIRQPVNAIVGVFEEPSEMSDCCSSSCEASAPRKHTCPVNGAEGVEVSLRTIFHHLKAPWAWAAQPQAYYFCSDPGCDVVYFGEDGSTLSKAEVRTTIGVKESSLDAPLCYCFGVSKSDALSDSSVKAFVVQKTKEGLCSCETSNPSGRCCLKDFPR